MAPPPDLDAGTRRDLTHLTVYAIDDEGTREVDDGVSAEPMPDGRVKVWIHIADATRFVHLGSPLEEEARRRSSSCYLPDRVVSMFPLDMAGRGTLIPLIHPDG